MYTTMAKVLLEGAVAVLNEQVETRLDHAHFMLVSLWPSPLFQHEKQFSESLVQKMESTVIESLFSCCILS